MEVNLSGHFASRIVPGFSFPHQQFHVEPVTIFQGSLPKTACQFDQLLYVHQRLMSCDLRQVIRFLCFYSFKPTGTLQFLELLMKSSGQSHTSPQKKAVAHCGNWGYEDFLITGLVGGFTHVSRHGRYVIELSLVIVDYPSVLCNGAMWPLPTASDLGRAAIFWINKWLLCCFVSKFRHAQKTDLIWLGTPRTSCSRARR